MSLNLDCQIDCPDDVTHEEAGSVQSWNGALAAAASVTTMKVRVPIRLTQPSTPRRQVTDRIIFMWVFPDAKLPEVIRDENRSYLRNTSIHHDAAIPVYDLATTHHHGAPA